MAPGENELDTPDLEHTGECSRGMRTIAFTWDLEGAGGASKEAQASGRATD